MKEIYFTSLLKHFSRSFLNSRTNCGKISSHLWSEQRFIVNCFKLSFQFSITSDLKRKGSGIVTHVANNGFCKSSRRTVVRFKTKQVLVPIRYSSKASRHMTVQYCCSRSAAVSKMILLKADVRPKVIVPSLNRHSRQTNTSMATNSRYMGEVQNRCTLGKILVHTENEKNTGNCTG